MKTIYCDVDSTLLWAPADSNLPADRYSLDINGRFFAVNHTLLNILQDCVVARGHSLVIWSAGGREWAERVRDALVGGGGGVNYEFLRQALCLSKPDFLFDDKDPVEWLPRRQEILPGARENTPARARQEEKAT